jgi:hypothetical protein
MAKAGKVAAGLVWLGIVLAGAAAAAQSEAPRLPLDARISANAPADWQPAAGLKARAGEAGAFHQRLAEQFASAIEARGWHDSDSAPAVLVFRYGVQATADPNQAPVQLRGSKGSSGGDEEAEVLLRLDLKRRGDGDGAAATGERVMDVTVSDRRNRVLWQATVKATVGQQGDQALAEALVPKVLDYLGRDAFEEPLR